MGAGGIVFVKEKEEVTQQMNRKSFLCAAAALCAAPALAFPAPEITSVDVAATDGSRARVAVAYTLSEPAIVLADVVTNVTGTASGDEYASIGPDLQLTFTGDIGRKVEGGRRSFAWYAAKDWPSNRLEAVKIRLTAYPTNRPPPYLVVDLAADAAERYRYYASAAAIPGFPESDLYRTRKLVMKYIRAKNIPWTMGAVGETSNTDERSHEVRLRSNYWMGVFELTVGQHAWFSDGSAANKANHYPLCRAGSYNAIRGADNLYPAEPSPGSYLGLLHARTGIWFDLPTEAQWEYVAKAGHGCYMWGDGTPMSLANLTNGVGQAVIAVSGGALERAGSRRPNDWGIYDMMGNVREACLDWKQADVSWNSNGIANASGGYLADGVTAGSRRVMRGGYYASAWTSVRPACREDTAVPGNWTDGFGLRLVTSFGLE